MKEKMFDVDEEKYIYLEPFWDVLRNSPEETDIDEAIKTSGLDKEEVVVLIKQAMREFNTKIGFGFGGLKNMFSMVSMSDLTLEKLAESYLFDKIMLLAKCKGMNMDMMFLIPPLDELRRIWIEKHGV
jgi:hypothetical protein